MERKTITTKKETSILKKQESKTEVSDYGHIRKTKSEILTEYVIVETQMVLDNGNARRYAAERENFPELVKENVTERKVMTSVHEEDVNTPDFCTKTDGNESFINRTDKISERFGEDLNNNKYDFSFENDGDRKNVINNKENTPARNFSSNLNASSCTTSQSNSFSQFENKSAAKERDLTSKETSVYNENTAKYVNHKMPKYFCPQSDLSKVEMSKMNSLIANFAMNLSQNDDSIAESVSDTEDDVIIVKMGKKSADREKDMYNKGDSYIISTGCKEQKKRTEVILDRESLEKSVSYLVNFFENIKNRASSKTNITERILTSKEKQNGKLDPELITKTHKFLSSERIKSFPLETDSNGIIDKNVKKSKGKFKMSAFSSGGKDLNTGSEITQIKSPNMAQTEVSSTKSSVPDAFCVLKYKRLEDSNENLKQDAKLEPCQWMTSDDDVRDEPKNVTNTSEISFISPRYACKKTRPHFCRPRVELQVHQKNDEINAAGCSRNGHRAEKRTNQKDVDNAHSGEVDKSSVFLTPKTINGLVKRNTSCQMDEHKFKINKRIVSITTKEAGNDGGCYRRDWTNSDKICFALALVFTMLLAYYKYSYNA